MGNNLDSENIMAKMTRVGINLSPYEIKLVTLWARLHNKPTATFCAQIIGAKVEEKAEMIRREVAEMAKSEGVTVEELEQQWLSGETEDS